jgi:N-acyl-D-amino-acid deacylase
VGKCRRPYFSKTKKRPDNNREKHLRVLEGGPMRRAIMFPILLLVAATDNPLPAKDDPEKLPVTGKPVPAMKTLDALVINYLETNKIPGATLAVVKGGKLVYARGFGYADPAKKEKMQPDALFRIASLTKPITSAAVMKLVEQGKLKLTDKVDALLKVKPFLEDDEVKVDPGLAKITVQHCLQHTAGWDLRKRMFDPMYGHSEICKSMRLVSPASPADLIRFMWGQKLDFEPGEREEFSNFGYCLLGRVIEKASGKSYEKYVNQNVLAPAGIKRMKLGRSLAKDRAVGEVTYTFLGQPQKAPAAVGKLELVPYAYGGFAVESMDSTDGWLASAVDLARFANKIMGPARSRLLKPKTMEAMFEAPPGPAGKDKEGNAKPIYYANGWLVRRDPPSGRLEVAWHLGLFAGTSSILVCRQDGVCWALLFNGSLPWEKIQPAAALDGPLHLAITKVTAWPAHNLFGSFK